MNLAVQFDLSHFFKKVVALILSVAIFVPSISRAEDPQILWEVRTYGAGLLPIAKGDQQSAQWAIMQGADAFLQKPFVVEDLIQVMNDVLNK